MVRLRARLPWRYLGEAIPNVSPDLIEGLDTLAAMRGTEEFLLDLFDRPDWVRESLGTITTRYFECYDELYELLRDGRGGSHFWAWAPGRLSKLQCDFSAMISPAMFGEFMLPVLRDMTARLDYCIYHWDGPKAIPHLDHLLAVEGIDVIQWTSGSGAAPIWDRGWWGLYHRILEAGKGIMFVDFEAEWLPRFRAEFGPKFRRFLFMMKAPSVGEGERLIASTEG